MSSLLGARAGVQLFAFADAGEGVLTRSAFENAMISLDISRSDILNRPEQKNKGISTTNSFTDVAASAIADEDKNHDEINRNKREANLASDGETIIDNHIYDLLWREILDPCPSKNISLDIFSGR